MAGKVLLYDFEYFENGKKYTDKLTVFFVSKACIRDYYSLMHESTNMTKLWDRYLDIKTELAALKKDKEKRKELLIEEEEIVNKMDYFADGHVEAKRFDLIKTIFKDNGIKNNKYFSVDFWDNCVNPNTEIDFLHLCIDKDMSDVLKKKAFHKM